MTPYKKQTCFWCKKETPLGIMHQSCRLDNEPTLQGVFSIFWYAGMAGRVVRSAKYRFPNPTAIHELCQHIPFSHRLDLLTLQRYIKAQAITYVPLSKDAVRKRGFNQSEHIARQVGSIMHLPVRALVSKITETPNQASRGRNERRLDSGMFYASSQGFTSVYLVDDVITTGTTLCTATQALHNAGMRSVYGITLCRS
ncbi:MAG: phosphoribosyltransferase family protein [Candidatus Roizmanbacteria bacterium]|nr:phosphoribosyltransferase family protein [Candidatus Roizmanbacteria bacterium]